MLDDFAQICGYFFFYFFFFLFFHHFYYFVNEFGLLNEKEFELPKEMMMRICTDRPAMMTTQSREKRQTLLTELRK